MRDGGTVRIGTKDVEGRPTRLLRLNVRYDLRRWESRVSDSLKKREKGDAPVASRNSLAVSDSLLIPSTSLVRSSCFSLAIVFQDFADMFEGVALKGDGSRRVTAAPHRHHMSIPTRLCVGKNAST